MSFIGRNFLISAVMLALPFTAQAATTVYQSDVSVGEDISVAGVMRPGNNVRFRFDILDDLTIPSFSVSATGNAAGLDLSSIRYGFSKATATNMFSTIETNGTSTFAGGFLPGFTLAAGDKFSVFFLDGISRRVALTVSFLSTAPSQVPLPAPALLLIAGLAAMGAIGKRKSKRANNALPA